MHELGGVTMRDKSTLIAPSERGSGEMTSERTRGTKAPGEGPSPFARILHGLGREVERGEMLVRRATNSAAAGQEMGNMDLLALQAGVYRYSEAVDLSAKLVDRATNGVKTVLQGQ